MNSAQIKFQITDDTFSPNVGLQGIVGYVGVFKRGPIGDAQTIISSPTQFLKIYGGPIAGNDDYNIVQRILATGAKVRISGARHYTDITTAGTLTATIATGGDIKNDTDEELFSLIPKYPGASYNNLRIVISGGSNGQPGYFNVVLYLLGEEGYTTETYKNLKITSVQDNSFLDTIAKGSELVNVQYKDLTAITGDLSPANGTISFSTGSDGGAVVDSDILGSPITLTGLNAFKNVDDIYAIGTSRTSQAIAVGGADYATGRKDIQFFFHLDNSYKTADQIVAAKRAMNIDTPYIEFWAGGVQIIDPSTGNTQEISAIGDILGLSAVSEKQFGAYRSFAGLQRGKISGAIGVVNNFGAGNDMADLDLLANNQINAVVNNSGTIYLSGNFSGQVATSHLSFNNVVRLITYIQRNLKPICQLYLEEPNDIPTWKQLYLDVMPFLDKLVSPDRALFGYSWQGDQFADTIADLKINNATDVGLGKYKILLYVKDITSLQEFTINIIISEASVNFDNE